MDTQNAFARVIEHRIQNALKACCDAPARPITVTVHGTHVTLTGDIHSWREHEVAERTARSMPGVTAVDNQLCLFVKAKLSPV